MELKIHLSGSWRIMKRISVVGFGKIGQAVTANILEHGIFVTAIDINPEISQLFSRNQFDTNEPKVKEILIKSFNKGNLEVTCDFKSIKDSQAIIICIPLLIDDSKNIIKKSFLDCIENIAPYLSNKCLLSTETTLPVGFSRKSILPLIEKFGKKHDQDFYLIYSPERIKSGTMLQQLSQNLKIIGGVNDKATKKGVEIYSWFLILHY